MKKRNNEKQRQKNLRIRGFKLKKHAREAPNDCKASRGLVRGAPRPRARHLATAKGSLRPYARRSTTAGPRTRLPSVAKPCARSLAPAKPRARSLTVARPSTIVGCRTNSLAATGVLMQGTTTVFRHLNRVDRVNRRKFSTRADRYDSVF